MTSHCFIQGLRTWWGEQMYTFVLAIVTKYMTRNDLRKERGFWLTVGGNGLSWSGEGRTVGAFGIWSHDIHNQER